MPSTELIQHTWNRLIEDFTWGGTQRRQASRKLPKPPRLTDGLRTEEVEAARRSSNTRRWATMGG